MNVKLTSLNFNHQRTVVCLPGFLGRSTEFQFLVDKLRRKFNFLLIDFKVSKEATFANLVTEVSDKINNTLGSQEIVLLGYSFGARLALAIYLQTNLKVSTLILESLNPGIQDKQARKNRVKKDCDLASLIRSQGLASFLNHWYQNPIFKNNKVSSDQMVKMASNYDPEEAACFLEKLSPGLMPNMWPDLDKINIPLKLINGENDQAFLGYAKKIKEIVACRSIVVSGAGHNIHSYHQDEYLEALF